ncbi:MAG: hypothetical protein EBY07_05555, partial [Actinobacteria bacterium]|nr:hypothetical protein [Actinomycetota bacterium]
MTLLPVIFFVGSSLASTRVNAEGAVDTSWGTSGVLCTNSGTSSGFTRDAVKLSDGSIISVGYGFITTSFNIIVTKTLPNGTPDSTFGTNGTVGLESLSSLFTSTYANNVAVQSDGKIVVAGAGTSASQQDVLVIRLTASGSLDPTFSGDGIVTVAPSSNDDNAHGVVVLPDGDIVIAGSTYQGAPSMGDLFMARINADGTFDATFDGDGILIRDLFGYSTEDFYDLIRRDDGTLLVGGTSGGNPVVVAVSPTGSLDTSFNGDGIARVTTLGGYLKSITLDADGKIAFGGTGPALSFTINTTMVGRLTSQGNLDTTFNGTGYNIFVTSDSAVIEDVVVQSDGKIGAVGRAHQTSDPTRTDVVAARFTTSGILDSSFTGASTTGYAVFGNPSRDDDGFALIVGTDGSFLVAATYWPTTTWCMSIVKLSTSLTPTSWTDQSLPSGTLNVAYSDSVASNLGSAATYSLTSGSLPTGVALSSNGAMAGTPTQSGSFPITITATTGSGTLNLSTSLVINQAPIATDSTVTSTGTVGTLFGDGVAASGYPAVTYTLTSGALPNGITLNSSTGAITGTPTVGGVFTYAISASNGVGSSISFGSKTLTISGPPVWNDIVLANATVGVPYSDSVAASGYPTPSFSVISGTTPPGLNLNSNGTFSGTALTEGTYTFVVQASNAVSLNVTAVDAQVGDEGGYVTVYPCLTGRPVVSNLNFTNRQTIPNAVIVPVDNNGNICVYVYGRAHIIIDVNGWFGTSTTFTPLSPQRIGDTRDNTGGVGTTKIGNGAEGGTALQFNVGLKGGVPSSGVAAVSLNVTAVDAQVGDEGGYVTVYPCLTGRPVVSN